MTQLSVRNLIKGYGDKEVLKGLSFDLESGERIGLVGGNGCGKSTLLRILAGREDADGGTLDFFAESRSSRGLLEQAPELATEELQQLSQERCPGEFRQALGELGMASNILDASPETYSGGERMKLALSGLLAEKPSLLLLDEPTNNLDFDGITALINTVNAYNGTLLMVSHDRYFLDCTVTRILELEDGKLTEYGGNYSDYRQEKARLREEKLHRWEEGKKQQEHIEQAIRQVKDWSAKAHRDSTKTDGGDSRMGFKEFNRAKAKRMDQQIKSQVKRLEKLRTESEERPAEESRVYFQVQSDGKRGKRVIEAEGLSKSFGTQTLFSNSDFVLLRGEHVALFGPNGCGKTTLVRMLQGREQPDNGRLWTSPSGDPFVLSQGSGWLADGKYASERLPLHKTPAEYYRSLWGRFDGEQRILLANMGLTARHLNQKLGTLSLGERMKVKLGELVLSKYDFIILDEPTNYLDLHAREMLEDTLAAYEGTLLIVSHDIYCLERVCDKVLLFENQRIRKLELSFRDYLERNSDNFPQVPTRS